MAKKSKNEPQQSFAPDGWQGQIAPVARRFDREYQKAFDDLPEEVEELSLFAEWKSGAFAARTASPFWDLVPPKKNQRCLDLGCGISFLIYPWGQWQAFFYGQEIGKFPCDTLNARGPQLNSKLFKGVRHAPAHRLDYEPATFDLAIATGFSCYYPLDYWQAVLTAVKPVLKPGGFFVFDAVEPDVEWVEDWEILESYLGAEVYLHSPDDWKKTIAAAGGKIAKQQPGELFCLYKVKFP